MTTVLLLPPSEGKAIGGTDKWSAANGRFGALAVARKRVLKDLKSAMADDEMSAKLLGLKAVALEKARADNRRALNGPTLPAHRRYNGVVWAHMDSALTPAARNRAADSVVVVSGLLGLVGWDDLIPEYKLKIGARLPDVGILANYWAPIITKTLNNEFADATFVDLLPNDYRKAIDFDALTGTRVKVDFVDRNRAAVGHNAKATKGLFAAYVLKTNDVFKSAKAFDGRDLEVHLS